MTQPLTPDILRKLLQVEPDIMRIASAAIVRPSQEFTEPVLEENDAAARIEAVPEIRRALAAHDWTASEFLQAVAATIQTVLAIEMLDAGHLTEEPSGAMSANIQLWRNPPTDLAAPLAEWKRREMDAILRILRD